MKLILGFLLAAFVGCFNAFSRTDDMIACNAYGGTRVRHESLTRTLEGAVAQRYLLATEGAAEGGADVCALATRPIGFFNDEGAIGDNLDIQRGANKTWLGIGSVAIAIDDPLYTTAGGKVSNVAAATSFFVGIARTAVSAGDAVLGGDSAIVEYEPAGPQVAAVA